MKKILHVEDDEVIRSLGFNVFKNTEFEYTPVRTAEEGFKIIKSKKIDLLLLDMKLSGEMQGMDLLKKLKRLKIKIKVVPLTASVGASREGFKKEFPKLVVAIMSKPFEPDKLLNSIRKLLKKIA